jgi:hypothetical protein
MRKSLSKPFKKLKHRFVGDRHGQEGIGGSEDNREGRETDVEESGAGKSSSPLCLGTGDVAGSGPGRGTSDVEGKKPGQVGDPPLSTTTISQIAEPDSV